MRQPGSSRSSLGGDTGSPDRPRADRVPSHVAQRRAIRHSSDDRTSITTHPVRGFLLDEASFRKICRTVARLTSHEDDSEVLITAEWQHGRATFRGYDSFNAYRNAPAYRLVRLSLQSQQGSSNHQDSRDEAPPDSDIQVVFRSCWLCMRPLAITVTSRNDLADRLSRRAEHFVRRRVRRKLPGGTFRLWKDSRPKLRHKIKQWLSRWIGQRLVTLMTAASLLLTLGYILFESCWPPPVSSNNADANTRPYEIPNSHISDASGDG